MKSLDYKMIGVEHNIPYVDMDRYIDTERFLSLSEEICKGISKSALHYSNPGNRTYPLENGCELETPWTAEQEYADIIKGMNDYEKRVFLKYYKKVLYSTSGVFIKKHKGYLNKHLDEYSELTENAKYFPKFLEYVNDLPFEQTGRIFIFLQDHFMPLVEHRDSMNDDYTGELTDFLWFTIDRNAMKFFIRDDNMNKHYVKSTCAWFNENNRHGSDGVDAATFCIRIDGVFNKEFKQQVLNDLK